jgi:hypothetical protein
MLGCELVERQIAESRHRDVDLGGDMALELVSVDLAGSRSEVDLLRQPFPELGILQATSSVQRTSTWRANRLSDQYK